MNVIDGNIIVSIRVPGLGKTAKDRNVPIKKMAEYAAVSVVTHLNSVLGAGFIKVDWTSDNPVAVSGPDRITAEIYGFKSHHFVRELENALKGAFRGEHDWLETSQVSEKAWINAVGFSMQEMLDEAVAKMESFSH